MAAQGWLGIHLPEEFGGQGFGLFELAVLLEETGWSVVPGPLLPTVRRPRPWWPRRRRPDGRAAILPGLADGSQTAALSLGDTRLDVVDQGRRRGADRRREPCGRCSARPPPRWCWPRPATHDGTETWCLLDVAGSGGRVRVAAPAQPRRHPPGRVVEVDALSVSADRQLPALTTRRLRQVAVALMAAEHVGGARWCLETATEYAKVRVQFGRPIGQFQAVKHRLADMAVRVEQMTAVAWDAAVAVSMDGPDGQGDSVELATATAGALTVDGYVRSSQECLQLLGGIGFTWEHDLHLHFKRAHADRQLLGETDVFRREVATVAGRGVRRELTADLPDEAEQARRELAPLMAELGGDAGGGAAGPPWSTPGLVVPHWPQAVGPGRRGRRAGGDRRAAGRGGDRSGPTSGSAPGPFP